MSLTFCEVCAPSNCESDDKRYHKERQLICGTVHLNCDRLKMNGLQDECRRRQCISNPDCYRGMLSTRRDTNSNQFYVGCCKNENGN